VDVHGSKDWILFEEGKGIAHPMIVIMDSEMDKFIGEVHRQQELGREEERQHKRKR
jgi:hypothetical protein